MKMRAADTNSKVITNNYGEIIGFALELANGRWAPFDKDSNTRLVHISVSFEKPKDVLNFFKATAVDRGAA